MSAESEKIANLAAAEAAVFLDAMAGLVVLPGVRGAAEQWKDDNGSLCVHCVCLTSLAGFIIGLCFVKVIKPSRKIKYTGMLSE